MPKTLTLPGKGEKHDSGNRANEGSSGAVGTENKEKLDRINAIADGADSLREAELSDIQDDGSVVPRETSTVQTEEPTDDTPPDDTQVFEPPKKFKLKVGGKDIELTEEEVIARAQKVENADEYLRTASQSVKTAATLALSEQDEPVKVDRKALVRAIQMGTEDEAEQALSQLFETLQPPKTPDVAEVVDSRLAAREAKAKFDEDYKDLLADPVLSKLVRDKDAELYEADKSLPYSERWRKAGDEVRTWAKSQGIKSVTSDKAARKALSTTVPTASGRHVQVQEEEESDAPQDVIAKMAKNRGQALQH